MPEPLFHLDLPTRFRYHNPPHLNLEIDVMSHEPAIDNAYLDTHRPFEERARHLVSQLTLQEKIDQILHIAPAIPRLNIPAYNWWNECLHGVARAGVATVFPQAIGCAASFNPTLLEDVAVAISDEARAKHHAYAAQGDHGIYKGLTFWSPNINIFRDPRWGRGHETYGECPRLTAAMGVAFVRGLQGNHPRYLKLVATPKHYAVHSGPESSRHRFNAQVSNRDLHETYLHAFRTCVQEAHAQSIMGAYNRTNGEPCCASPTLLQTILRETWAFDGYVVSDCGAIRDLHEHHKVTQSPAESAALAVKNGCDLNCGEMYHHLPEAVKRNLIAEADIDRAVIRLFTAHLRLGMFDPPEDVPYTAIPYEVVGCDRHRALARRMARESMVLLKNTNKTLPLSRDLKSIAVIGPNADSDSVLIGNYFGVPGHRITLLEGIRRAVSPDTRVWYSRGSKLYENAPTDFGAERDAGIAEAKTLAARADVVVLCLGLDPFLEGEEGDIANSDGQGDRTDVRLPACQERLLEALRDCGKPIVLVLTGGSPMTLPDTQDRPDAILLVWYPGQEGGHALADILFGDASPAGRLPVTFVKSLDQVPPFDDYRMAGRTYRFMDEEPLHRFGYGLSYTTFAYGDLTLTPTQLTEGTHLTVTLTVTNTGAMDSDDVVQAYLVRETSSIPAPRRQLVAFRRMHLRAGESRPVSLTIPSEALRLYADDGASIWVPGPLTIAVGGSQPGTPGATHMFAEVERLPS